MGEIAVKRFWATGTPLGKYAIGATVLLKVDGVATPFLVAHHGKTTDNTNSLFENATWLLAKSKVTDMAGYGAYVDSDIDNYLNGTYFQRFSTKIQNTILSVPIGVGANGNLAATITRKIFILSCDEADHNGASGYYLSLLGDGTTDSLYQRSGGESAGWWTRTGFTNTREKWMLWYHIIHDGIGMVVTSSAADTMGILPALILPDKTPVAKSGLIG